MIKFFVALVALIALAPYVFGAVQQVERCSAHVFNLPASCTQAPRPADATDVVRTIGATALSLGSAVLHVGGAR